MPVAAQSNAAQRLAVYDPVTSVLSLPSVRVGAETYAEVKLLNVGNYTFTLQAATPQIPAGPGVSTYDLSTNVLTIPAVKVGAATFLDVTLLNLGNYTFALRAAVELPVATSNAVNGLLANVDALWAQQVPRTGELRMSLSDACWRHEGKTRAMAVSEVDVDPNLSAQRDADRVGATSRNLQVLALRNGVNPDGSTRQEIDVQYDVVYRDGTTLYGTYWTLVSGSTSGTPGCSTPQNSASLRFLGNQRLLSVSVRARNVRDERHSVASGAALSPAVNYRRLLQWAISDPASVASYVVVTGPGPGVTQGSTTLPFSLKFISPRLLRSAAALQGKAGNYLNWQDDDQWRFCRVAGSSVPLASTADCVGQGATAFDLGITTATPNAAADQSFSAQGWVAGAVYRFDVYNDEGWRTVNGHAAQAPIATYFSTLEALPYSFVEVASSSAGDKFPRMSFGGLSHAQVQANALSATPAPLNVSWNAPAPFNDGRRFGLQVAYDFHQGAKVGNSAGTFNPAYRWTFNNYPAATALSIPAWAVAPKPADQLSKSYFEYTLLYSDRNNVHVLSTVSFQ